MADEQNSQAAAYQAQIIALYVLAEQQLLAGVSRILTRAIGSYAEHQAAVTKVRRLVQPIVRNLTAHTGRLVTAMMAAEGAGGASASITGAGQPPFEPPDDDLPPFDGFRYGPEPFDFSRPEWDRAVEAIREDLDSTLDDVRKRITRLPDDVYKIVAPEAAMVQVTDDGGTYVTAQRHAYQEFIRRGVTGFTDKGGRDWSLSAYVEMAVRTASARAFDAAHLQVIQASGENLVTVTSDGNPCPLCFPWQNRVCCIVADGVHPTIDDAIAAGLKHPNCRHTWVGVSNPSLLPPVREWTDAMQARYDAGQKQRTLELQIRKAKRQLEYARDGESRQEARVKVRKAQQRLRDHVAAHDHLERTSRREQPNLTMHRSPQ